MLVCYFVFYCIICIVFFLCGKVFVFIGYMIFLFLIVFLCFMLVFFLFIIYCEIVIFMFFKVCDCVIFEDLL